MRADIHAALTRHQRVAFQFSGGRDSLAALYLMRAYWDRMRVYHLDAGDQFPELRAVVDAVNQWVPITRIKTSAPAWRAVHGIPSDLVPVDNTPMGQMLSGRFQRIANRNECCWANLMQPMHQRMLADGITLIVRGVRADEFLGEMPTRSGWTGEGLEMLYPIEHWSAQEVDDYIAVHELPVAPFYAQGMKEAPECMGCTAWWTDGKAQYLRQHHPDKWHEVRLGLGVIRAEAVRQLATLDDKE